MARVPIPEDTAAEVLFNQRRTCCVCNIQGKSVQIHHIDEDPSNNDPANLAVLCLECHEQTQINGGFGRKLRATEVTKYRDDWVRRVADQKAEADRIIVSNMVGAAESQTIQQSGNWKPPSDNALLILLNSLPHILRAAYDHARPLWDSGITVTMKQGSWIVTEVLEQTWARLAAWYSPNHFGKPASQFFSEYLEQRAKWHSAISEPAEVGWQGTNHGVILAGRVLEDAEDAIAETVGWLISTKGLEIDIVAWRAQWDEAKSRQTNA
jgi:hypothetical protein